MEGTDVCFAPVLSMSEVAEHPHNKFRKTFVEFDGALQPAPAPRFSRTSADIRFSAHIPGQDTQEVLTEWGFSETEIAALKENSDIA